MIRKLAWKAVPLAVALFAAHPSSAAAPSPWRDIEETSLRSGQAGRVLFPVRFRLLELDSASLRATLGRAPLEFTAAAADEANAVVVSLPMPDGTAGRFRVEESPIMEPELAAQLPEIRTYRGQGLDDRSASTRLGWTSAGFHAIVLSARGTVFIDPYRRGDTRHYLSYFKRDYRAPAGKSFRCLLDETVDDSLSSPEALPSLAPSGDTLRTYRLAVAANVEYSTYHSSATPPDRNDVMNNGIVPTMNRVNGVYERDVAVRMVLVANEMSIIFVVEPDGYDNTSNMINVNQGIIDGIIGSANYDIGHVFSTGGGGVAQLRVPCNNSSKARGVTGSSAPIGDPFDIDYVAHEMGHQFGANHPFNGNAGACAGGNRNASTAYEVGSGSTIMAYAGICGAQNLQPHSDDDFHNISFVEIRSFTTNPSTGDSCPVRTATGNQAPTIDAGPAYSIPSRTPFALTAAGSDPDGDALTYSWEEFDLGPAGDGRTDNGSSPILRAFARTSSPTRIFPKLSDILDNVTTYGELLPTTTRVMTFRVTARDGQAGGGGVEWDATTVSVQSTAGPFRVTSPNTNVLWTGSGSEVVTWDVAGTTAAPISTANVDIRLSVDGGRTFPFVLASGVPNDGSQAVTVPNLETTTARLEVAGAGNIFFDISDADFRIQLAPVVTAVPVSLAVDAAGNGVLQPGETVAVEPAWQNVSAGTLTGATGALSAFTGPAGPSYTISDGAASYGTLASGAAASCAASGDCYALSIGTGARPALHWDSAVVETFSPAAATKSWTLHVGDSFTDVPASSAYYRFVETLLHHGVTGGCGATTYCPSASATRGQMAVFALVGKEGASYSPAACGTTPMFTDVPVTDPLCRWVEELVRRGIAGGCTATTYCPSSAVTRAQMAIFMLKTLDPSIDPPACGTPIFADVPAGSPYCRWIEELSRRGVVSGCGGGNYCPASAVTRQQMAVFISSTFGLALYGL